MQVVLTMQVGNLPLKLIFLANGMIAFTRLANFAPIIDNPADGLQAIIDSEGIYIGSETEIEYNTAYQFGEMPELLAWLVAQKLIYPEFVQRDLKEYHGRI